MKEYFLAILAIAVIGGIIISLSPDGASAKYIRLLCGICTVGCIVIPIVSYAAQSNILDENWLLIFDSDQYVDQYDEIYNSALVDAEISNADYLLKNKIIQEFVIKDEDFDVHIKINEESVEKYIECVELRIYAQGIEIDPHSIEKYVKNLLGCECITYYDF